MEQRIFCLMGKSGTGKDTLANLLFEKNPNLIRLVPYTTRPKRPGETEGKEYHFVDDDEYLLDLQRGKVIEHRTYEHYADGAVKYYTYDDTVPGSNDYLLITTPDAFNTIRNYFEHKGSICMGIYLYMDPIKRLECCYNREVNHDGNKYKELIRRFIADEKDYPDDVIRQNEFITCLESVPGELNSLANVIAEFMTQTKNMTIDDDFNLS